MSKRSTHIIRKQVVELDVPHRASARFVQEKVAGICRDLWPQIEAICNRYEAEGITFSFDQVVLDLGEMDAALLHEDFSARLLHQLEATLERSLAAPLQAQPRATPGVTTMEAPAALRAPTPNTVQAFQTRADVVALFEHFIETGQRSWWSQAAQLPAPAEWVKQVTDQVPSATALAWWQKWAGQATPMRRLFRQFPAEALLPLLAKLSGRSQSLWQREVVALSQLVEYWMPAPALPQRAKAGYILRGLYLEQAPAPLAELTATQAVRGIQQLYQITSPTEATWQLARTIQQLQLQSDSPLAPWVNRLQKAPDSVPEINPTDPPASFAQAKSQASAPGTTENMPAGAAPSNEAAHLPEETDRKDPASTETATSSNPTESNPSVAQPSEKLKESGEMTEGASPSPKESEFQAGPTATASEETLMSSASSTASPPTEKAASDAPGSLEELARTEHPAEEEEKTPEASPSPAAQREIPAAESSNSETPSSLKAESGSSAPVGETTPSEKAAPTSKIPQASSPTGDSTSQEVPNSKEASKSETTMPSSGSKTIVPPAGVTPSSAEEDRQAPTSQIPEEAPTSNKGDTYTSQAAEKSTAPPTSENKVQPTAEEPPTSTSTPTESAQRPNALTNQNTALDPEDPAWRERWSKFWASQERQASKPAEASPGPLWRKPHQAEVAGEWFVTNGGLVLLWPFLSRFFGTLGLVTEGAFVDEVAAERAAHILQVLATGEPATPEHELVLNKWLCGLPLDHVLPSGIELSTEEEQECLDLLSAAAKNWPALKSTSAEGFRKTFMLREAKLAHEDGLWKLNVAPTSVDVLQNTRPWPVSLIKLPWNEESLYVTW